MIRKLALCCSAWLLVACPQQISPPTARVAELRQVNLGEIVALDGRGSSDAQGRALLFGWSFVSLPPGSQAQLNDPRSQTPSFTADQPGDYEVQLVVNNGLLSSGPVIVTATARPCGAAAPKVTDLTANPATPSAGQTVTLSTAISDADNSDACKLNQTFGYAWSMSSRPEGSGAVLEAPSSARPSFVPDLLGSYGFQLVVTDASGRSSAAGHLTVKTSACGNAAEPSVTASASNPNPNIGQTISLSAVATDPDNGPGCGTPQTFTFAWSILGRPSGSAATLSATTAPSPTFIPDLVGSYLFQVNATDSAGRFSRPALLAVSTTQCGSARPFASASVSNSAPNINQAVTLSAEAVDADNEVGCGLGQTLSYAWRVLTRPGGSTAALSSAAVASPTFVPDVVGAYQFQVTVTDSTSRTSSPATVLVTTSACGSAAPTVTASASSLNPRITQTVSLRAVGTDSDNGPGCNLGQSLSYLWAVASAPAGSTAALSSTTAPSPAFIPDLVGSYQLRVTVTDSTGRSSWPETITLSTSSCGASRPRVSTAASISDPLGNPVVGSQVGLSALVADDDNLTPCSLGQTFSYRWSFASRPAGSGASLSSAAVANPSFVVDVAGTYLLQARVTDSAGLEQTSTITVGGCGSWTPSARVGLRAPVVIPGAPSLTASFPLGSLIQLDGADSINPTAGVAVCGQPETLSYYWSFTQLPAGASPRLNNGNVVDPSFTMATNVSGLYGLTLEVELAGRRSAPATVALTALNPISVVERGSGPFSAVAIEPLTGNPVVAYLDNNSGRVRVSRCTGGCSSGSPVWTLMPDADTGIGRIDLGVPINEMARPIALALAPGNLPVVAYHAPASCAIKVASWSGAAWNVFPLEVGGGNCEAAGARLNSGNVGYWLSLALNGSNNPAVAYWKSGGANTEVSYRYCQSGCLGAGPSWTAANVVASGARNSTVGPGAWPSLAFSSGNPRVAYYDAPNGQLRYAECNNSAGNSNCTAAGSFTTLLADDGASGDVGRFASLAVTSTGIAKIIYRDQKQEDLRYAWCTSTPCNAAGKWQNGVAVSNNGWTSDVGWFGSLALDASGNPRASFLDGTGKLSFAQSSGGAWSYSILDSSIFQLVGGNTSLALSPLGGIRVSYVDQNSDLKLYASGP